MRLDREVAKQKGRVLDDAGCLFYVHVLVVCTEVKMRG